MDIQEIQLLDGQRVKVTFNHARKQGKCLTYDVLTFTGCQEHAHHFLKRIKCVRSDLNLAIRQNRGNSRMKELQESIKNTADAYLLNNLVSVCYVKDHHDEEYDYTDIVMEKAQGRDLDTFRSLNNLSFHDFFKLYQKFLQTFDWFRKSDFIHRDVRPDNMFLQWKDGQIDLKFFDFGNSKTYDKMITNNSTNIYLPPGICRSKKFLEGEESQAFFDMDLYAATCLLWKLCFQQHIFQYSSNDTDEKIFAKIEYFKDNHQKRIEQMCNKYECPEAFRRIFLNVFNPNYRNFADVLTMINSGMEKDVNDFDEDIHYIERVYVRCRSLHHRNLCDILSSVCQCWLRAKQFQQFDRYFQILKDFRTNFQSENKSILQSKQSLFYSHKTQDNKGKKGIKKKRQAWKYKKGEIMVKETERALKTSIEFLKQLKKQMDSNEDDSDQEKYEKRAKIWQKTNKKNVKDLNVELKKILLDGDEISKEGTWIIVKKRKMQKFENEMKLMEKLNEAILKGFNLQNKFKDYKQVLMPDENEDQNALNWKHFLDFLQNT